MEIKPTHCGNRTNKLEIVQNPLWEYNRLNGNPTHHGNRTNKLGIVQNPLWEYNRLNGNQTNPSWE